MDTKHESTVTHTNEINRRSSSRLEVLERIQSNVKLLDVPIKLLNISQGGFMMRTSRSFPLGGIYEFRFTSPRHAPVVLRGRVIHRMRATAGGTVSYVTGVAFLDGQNSANKIAVDLLLGLL
jgi:hypothetical protein